jgi:hypothetical protein
MSCACFQAQIACALWSGDNKTLSTSCTLLFSGFSYGKACFWTPIWSFATPHSGCQDEHFCWGWHSASQKTSGIIDEENAHTQVCNSLDLCFIACEFFLNSHDSSDRRKPSTADPSKKLAQRASSSHATLVAPSAGVTGFTTLSAAKAWDYCRRTTEFLYGLKNREADQEGNRFISSLFLFFNLFGWHTTFLFVVLANNLKAAQKALSDEKSARLRAENSLAEEKAARQAAAQFLQQSNDANDTLALELETAQTSLAATRDK